MSKIEVGQEHQANLKSATLTAVVTRADGTVEELGVISHYERPTGLRGFAADVLGAYRKARRGDS